MSKTIAGDFEHAEVQLETTKSLYSWLSKIN